MGSAYVRFAQSHRAHETVAMLVVRRPDGGVWLQQNPEGSVDPSVLWRLPRQRVQAGQTVLAAAAHCALELALERSNLLDEPLIAGWGRAGALPEKAANPGAWRLAFVGYNVAANIESASSLEAASGRWFDLKELPAVKLHPATRRFLKRYFLE